MDGTVASQIQAIKSHQRGGSTDHHSTRRPLTRPSIIFNPKEAADIDVRTILPIAISGLDVLMGMDSQYKRYKDSLFNDASLDIDREKMVPNEEKRINKSISSYLRLLAGHLHHPSALKTLEYLIRRFQIHIFNVDELVLCALPYHDTHAFVKIVQLIDLRNKIWGFLEASQTSGASPPRKVIVQQCLHDKAVLEAICDYASPTNKFCHAKPVIAFSTAVIIEALGSAQKLDDETIRRVLPFMFNSLNPAMRGDREAKAGALMIAGLLASRANLAPKLVHSLMFFIARMTQQDLSASSDLPWLRMIVMTIITIIQSQSLDIIPEKSLKVLVELRELSGILAGLSKDFNIDKFTSLYFQTLADRSLIDNVFCSTLISSLKSIPAKTFVGSIVLKVLKSSLKILQNKEESSYLHEAGARAKQIFTAIHDNYNSEFRMAIEKFFLNFKRYSTEEDSMLKSLCLMFDGGLDMPFGSSYSQIWFSLHHPKACVRQATLLSLSSSGVLKANSFDQQLLVDLKETIIRQLHDDDLAIVQAALSIEELSVIMNPPDLLNVIEDVLCRCMSIISTSTSNIGTPGDVVGLCLRTAIKLDNSRKVASMLFPLLLVLPKTWKLNLTGLEFSKVVQWPFYSHSFSSLNIFNEEFSKFKMLEHDRITALNLDIVEAMAQSFIQDPRRYIEWLCECSKKTGPSKSLFLFIMLRSISIHKRDVSNLFELFEVCFSVVKDEWQAIISKDNSILCKKLTEEAEDKSLEGCLNQLSSCNFLTLNAKVIVCICWAFLEAFAAGVPNKIKVDDCKRISMLENLFIFFTSTTTKEVFKVHIFFLLTKCGVSPIEFLSRFYTDGGFPSEVQVESLVSFATVCSASAEINSANANRPAEFLDGSPSLLVPLSHPRKDIRAAALNCVEVLQNLCTPTGSTRANNGNDEQLIRCTSASLFGRLLGFICEQKRLILSDVNCVQSLLTSMLGHTSKSFLVPQNTDKRFDQQAKDTILLYILNSALRMPSCAKLSILSLLEGIGSSILWINEVKSLVSELLERRKHHFTGFPKESTNRLSESEIETLCILLKISIEKVKDKVDPSCADYLIGALKVDGSLSDDDPAVVKPCLSVLSVLTSTMYSSLDMKKQDEIFVDLVFLIQNGISDIKSAAKEVLLQINVNYLSIVKFIEGIISDNGSASQMKRKKTTSHHSFFSGNLLNSGKMTLCLLNSLLNFLILKKDLQNRKLLVASLFNLLKELFSDKFCKIYEEEILITNAQQATLFILENICISPTSEISVKDKLFSAANVNLLIECAQCTENAETRNHIFLLLVAIANISSEYVSECMHDIVSVIAKTATKQTGSHSQQVLERMLSILVPCWISKTDGIKGLLEVFTNILPEIGESRRLTLMVYLLRILGEKCSLGTFLVCLFHSLVSRKSSPPDYERCLGDLTLSASILKEWEFLFAVEICNQFSCNIWLSSFISLLEEMGNDLEHDKHNYEMLLVLHFIMQKLHTTELIYELEHGEQASHLQCLLGSIMEKVMLQQEPGKTKCTTSIRKQLNEAEVGLLKAITDIMVPSQYYKSITRLLNLEDVVVIKKALGFLSESLKSTKHVARKHNYKFKQLDSRTFHINGGNRQHEAFDEMCYKLIQLVDKCCNELLVSLKLPALSSLEILVNEFISDDNIFILSLRMVLKHIRSNDFKVSSCCLRCISTLIRALGSKALPELHNIMEPVLEKASGNCKGYRRKNGAHSYGKTQLSISVLMTLEAIVENLGCFLSPFLEKIIELLVLNPEYALESDPRIKSKALLVRMLLVEKVPVRITLTSLLKIYPRALEGGEASLCLVFEMLITVVGVMDKASVRSFYTSIFEHCLLALDLRRQHLDSIKNIASVEEHVVRAIAVLTLKLTESMFRPLFLRTLEWAESDTVADDMTCLSTERNISFYNLVNKLAEEQRSLFVPYFKYLLDGCTYHLRGDRSNDSLSRTHKKKKAKTGQEFMLKEEELLTPQKWHLRALILASLYKCFLYDSGNLKFLNNTNFQILLKPIVSQLVAEPPVLQGHFPDIPTIEEVDESLVCCLGQMATAVGSDDAWKQLNHEVLMQTRSEKIRPRMLGLKVVKFLLDHLKEEYLVLLPETIPFLGELLEDTEPSVKSLAQEVFKELEKHSGENLQQYL